MQIVSFIKKSLLVFVLSYLGIQGLQAQALGYQGKKLTASGYVGISPAILHTNKLFGDAESSPTFDFNYGIQVDYALFENTSFGFERNAFSVEVNPTSTYPILDKSQNINGAYQFQNERFKVSEWAFGTKFFFNNSAPLGSFMGLRLGAESIRSEKEYIDQLLVYDYNNIWQPSPDILPRKMDEPIKRSGLLTIEFGINRIIADRVLFHYGVSSRFMLQKRQAETFESFIYDRVRTNRYFRFELGIGYLIW